MREDDDLLERRRRFARPRDPDESVREDVARYVGAPPGRHAEDLAAVCRMVEATLESRPDREAVLAYQDPRSREAEALWLERFRKSPVARRRSPDDPQP